MGIKHKKINTVPDGAPTGAVQPSDWNALHEVLLNVNRRNGASYVVTDDDAFGFLSFNQDCAVSLPQASADGPFRRGWFSFFVGPCTITPAVSLIAGAPSFTIPAGQSSMVVSDGVDYVTSGISVPAMLIAMAALSTSADKVLYFSGANTPALAPFTAYARSLAAAADAAGARTVLAAAALNSPALTGAPTAPTATLGNNSTLIATTAFVKNAIDALLNGAPAALDTLKELADAIADDANFAATITAALATKVAMTRTIAAAGLATGGGDLTADRTITVPVASQSEAQLGTDNTKAMTPLRVAQAIAALGASLASDLETTLGEMAMQMSDTAAIALFLGGSGNRFADSFKALTYVDVAGATNLDSSVAGLLKPTSALVTSYANSGGAGNRTASITVTSNMTAQSPTTWAALVNGSTASDGTNSVDDPLGVTTITAGDYITFDFGVGVKKYIDESSLYVSTGTGRGTWKWRGSNDNATWTDVSAAVTWALGMPLVVPLSGVPSAGYRYYQWVAVSGGTWPNGYLNEFEFKLVAGTATPTNNLTVRSSAFTAASVPTTATVLAKVTYVDTPTLNTDLIVEVSRDGGTTWTAAVMSALYTVNSITVLQSASIDLTAQPSGTSMRWRVRTANNKNVYINDVYLYWR